MKISEIYDKYILDPKTEEEKEYAQTLGAILFQYGEDSLVEWVNKANAENKKIVILQSKNDNLDENFTISLS